MPITKEQANIIARREIEGLNQSADQGTVTVVLMEEHTISTTRGWVFCFQSKKYLDSGNPSFQLAGNAPFFVDNEDGAVTWLSSGMSLEKWLGKLGAQRVD